MSERAIGLDIGSSSIKAAEVVRRNDGTYAVVRQASRPLPVGVVTDGHVAETEQLKVAEQLKSLWAEEKFGTRDVILGLNSSASVFMEEMLVPVMQPEDVEKAMPEIIAARNSNLSPDENEFSFTVVGEEMGEHGPQLRVLVFSVRTDFNRELGELVESAGLNVVGVDLNALATLRAIDIRPRPPGTVDAIVDIGAHVTSLTLHHNGVPKMLYLDPDSAGQVATKRIADAMGTDDDLDAAEWQKINSEDTMGPVAQARNDYCEGLAKKVAGGFRSYLDRSDEFDSIATLTLVGGGGDIYGLGWYLSRELGEDVPLEYARVAPNLVDERGAALGRSEYLAAIGLGTARRA